MAKNWFKVQVVTGHENRVKDALLERMKAYDLHFQTWIPADGMNSPGYVLIQRRACRGIRSEGLPGRG